MIVQWWIVYGRHVAHLTHVGRYQAQTGEGAILQHAAQFPRWRSTFPRLVAIPEDQIVEGS